MKGGYKSLKKMIKRGRKTRGESVSSSASGSSELPHSISEDTLDDSAVGGDSDSDESLYDVVSSEVNVRITQIH